jgi:hypothetical protein
VSSYAEILKKWADCLESFFPEKAAACRAGAESLTWRSIDEAPKDVEIIGMEEDGSIGRLHWHECCPESPSSSGWYDNHMNEWAPTRWKVLGTEECDGVSKGDRWKELIRRHDLSMVKAYQQCREERDVLRLENSRLRAGLEAKVLAGHVNCEKCGCVFRPAKHRTLCEMCAFQEKKERDEEQSKFRGFG